MLSPGRYDIFVGCADDTGCPQLRAGGLSVQGALSTPVGVPADSANELRSEAGQSFRSELSFSISAPEPVRFTPHADLGQSVFIAPSEDELPALLSRITVAAMSGTVLGGSPPRSRGS